MAPVPDGAARRPGPVLGVGALAVRDGRVLLVRRGHGPAGGTWAVPGGRVEHGEALAEAVVRELAEETGLEAVCGPLVGRAEVIDEEAGHHLVVLDFEVTVLGGELRAGDDAAEAAWVALADVLDRPLAPGMAELLADLGLIDAIC